MKTYSRFSKKKNKLLYNNHKINSFRILMDI